MGDIHFDDLNLTRNYSAKRATVQVQLVRNLFTYELARRTEMLKITVNAAHAGPLATSLMDEDPELSPVVKMVAKLGKPLLGPLSHAAATILYLATSPEVANVTGKYFIDKKPVRSSDKSYDTELALRLWQVNKELTKHGDSRKSFEPLHDDSNAIYTE